MAQRRIKDVVGGSLKLGTAALPLAFGGGFLAFRFYVRSEVRKGIMAEYDHAPLLMGNVFYSAVHGVLPIRQVSRKEMRRLAHTLAVEFVPLMSFSIPDNTELREIIKARAIPSAVDTLLELL
jgi:hypothetical protein